MTDLPFKSAANKFAAQGAHDAHWCNSQGHYAPLAVSLYKIANDIRLLSCGPRAGFAELIIPANEPGSSIMPGKVNPSSRSIIHDHPPKSWPMMWLWALVAETSYLEMNVYKPLIIFNIMNSITLMSDGCTNFRKFLIENTKPNLRKIKEYVDRSLMLVTALAPVIGYDKASEIAHYALRTMTSP